MPDYGSMGQDCCAHPEARKGGRKTATRQGGFEFGLEELLEDLPTGGVTIDGHEQSRAECAKYDNWRDGFLWMARTGRQHGVRIAWTDVLAVNPERLSRVLQHYGFDRPRLAQTIPGFTCRDGGTPALPARGGRASGTRGVCETSYPRDKSRSLR